eukprot:scaffold6349_cov115-Isochrysis_galbana.AAC.5
MARRAADGAAGKCAARGAREGVRIAACAARGRVLVQQRAQPAQFDGLRGVVDQVGLLERVGPQIVELQWLPVGGMVLIGLISRCVRVKTARAMPTSQKRWEWPGSSAAASRSSPAGWSGERLSRSPARLRPGSGGGARVSVHEAAVSPPVEPRAEALPAARGESAHRNRRCGGTSAASYNVGAMSRCESK